MIYTSKRTLVDEVIAIFVYIAMFIYPCYVLVAFPKNLWLAFILGSLFSSLNKIYLELKEMNEKTGR